MNERTNEKKKDILSKEDKPEENHKGSLNGLRQIFIQYSLFILFILFCYLCHGSTQAPQSQRTTRS